MKKEFIIGEKASLDKKFYIHLFFSSILFYSFYVGFINMLSVSSYIIQYPISLTFMKITLIFAYFLSVILTITGKSLKQYIVINEHWLAYYSNINFLSQMKNSLCIVFNKERQPALKISLDQIQKIVLLYNTITSSFYYSGHSLVYRIELKDGTSITINPDSFHFSNDSIVEGIEYIREKGILVDDPYELMIGLQKKDMKFAEYIDKVVKQSESHL